MIDSPLKETSEDTGMQRPNEEQIAHEKGPSLLYITLGPEGAFKAGTCEHCVVYEPGRPERAWDANGDSELDFDRDTLFAHLSDLGISLTNRQAYICP
jgi:hypothetical protein